MEGRLLSLPVGRVMSLYVTFSSTGELTSTRLIGYGINCSILYYCTVIYTVVIDIIIYYRMDRHLFGLPVGSVVSQSVSFSSTGELTSTRLIMYGIYITLYSDMN